MLDDIALDLPPCHEGHDSPRFIGGTLHGRRLPNLMIGRTTKRGILRPDGSLAQETYVARHHKGRVYYAFCLCEKVRRNRWERHLHAADGMNFAKDWDGCWFSRRDGSSTWHPVTFHAVAE